MIPKRNLESIEILRRGGHTLFCIEGEFTRLNHRYDCQRIRKTQLGRGKTMRQEGIQSLVAQKTQKSRASGRSFYKKNHSPRGHGGGGRQGAEVNGDPLLTETPEKRTIKKMSPPFVQHRNGRQRRKICGSDIDAKIAAKKQRTITLLKIQNTSRRRWVTHGGE